MKLISIIIPAFNEEQNILPVFESVREHVLVPCAQKYAFEILFVNDGSRDGTLAEIEKISQRYPEVKFVDFSRNFGKELATTAGLHMCSGDAAIMIDADLQHPAELIPKFLEKWEEGYEVVVGIRKKNAKETHLLKRIGSGLFYTVLRYVSESDFVPRSTDFRLMDRVVIDEFKRFGETGRMTRALIDWLGFRRAYISFVAKDRLHGTASYNFLKLVRLAVNGFVSLSLLPLKFASYLGSFITVVSGILGFYILLGKYVFRWSFALTFSDAENLAILILFLVGILLISIGFIAFYIANIHSQVVHRPLYVVRRKNI